MSFKKNDKGFSLVELIIVIAIMAVLTGVLLPQYLKYVEKSRIAADEKVLKDLEDVLLVAATSGELKWDGMDDATDRKDLSIYFDSKGKIKYTDTETKENWDIISEMLDKDVQSYTLKSKHYKLLQPDVKVVSYGDGSFYVKIVARGKDENGNRPSTITLGETE